VVVVEVVVVVVLVVQLLMVRVLDVVENLVRDIVFFVVGPALLLDASLFVLSVGGLCHGPCLLVLDPTVPTFL
jgi:hypothetical protein